MLKSGSDKKANQENRRGLIFPVALNLHAFVHPSAFSNAFSDPRGVTNRDIRKSIRKVSIVGMKRSCPSEWRKKIYHKVCRGEV